MSEEQIGLIMLLVFFIGCFILVLFYDLRNKIYKSQTINAYISYRQPEFAAKSFNFNGGIQYVLRFTCVDHHLEANNNKVLKFKISRKYFDITPYNVYGELTYKGSQIISFKNDEIDIDYTK